MSAQIQDPVIGFVDAIARRVVELLRAEQEPRYIDAREVAKRLGRPVRTVHHWARVGTIPHVPQGGRVMFVWADVQKALEER